MRPCHPVVLLGMSLCCGCASPTHQIAESDAHGVLRFSIPDYPSGTYREVYQVDGERVKLDKHGVYRATPGDHVVVFRDVRSSVETHEFGAPRIGLGSPAGVPVDLDVNPNDGTITESSSEPSFLSGSGSRPIGRIRSQGQQRVTTLVRNTVQVTAGWEYQLDGFGVRERPIGSGQQFRLQAPRGEKKAAPAPVPVPEPRPFQDVEPTLVNLARAVAASGSRQALDPTILEWVGLPANTKTSECHQVVVRFTDEASPPARPAGSTLISKTIAVRTKGDPREFDLVLIDRSHKKAVNLFAASADGSLHTAVRKYIGAGSTPIPEPSGPFEAELAFWYAWMREGETAARESGYAREVETAATGAASGEPEIFSAIRDGDEDRVRAVSAEDPAATDLRNRLMQTPLHIAAEQGRLDIVRELARQGAGIDVQDEFDKTALLLAAGGGHAEVVRELLERGANANARDHLQNTAMDAVFAAWLGLGAADPEGDTESRMPPDDPVARYTACIRHLLKHGADPNAVSGLAADTPLQRAVFVDAPALVPILIEAGAKVDALSQGGTMSALHLAAMVGSVECASALLEHGATMSPQATGQKTPLHFAALFGQKEVADLLLSHGAGVNTRGPQGSTALQDLMTVDWKSQNVSSALSEAFSRMLGQWSADPRVKKLTGLQDGINPFLQSGFWGRRLTDYSGVAEVLIKHGADIHQLDDKGRTPLMEAAFKGNADGVAFLLEEGADIETRDGAGFTPLLTAAEFGHTDVLTRLLRAGANLDARTPDQRTALHLAASGGFDADTRALLEQGADVDAVDSARHTSLLYAAFAGHPSTVESLIAGGASLDIRSKRSGLTPLLTAVEGAKMKANDSKGLASTPANQALAQNFGTLDDYADVARRLVAAGADVGAVNHRGETAARLAARYHLDKLAAAIRSAPSRSGTGEDAASPSKEEMEIPR